MPRPNAIQRQARILLRATRITATRREIIREAQALHRDAFNPMVDAYINHLDGLKTGAPGDAIAAAHEQTFSEYLNRINLSQAREAVTNELTWVFGAAYLRMKAVNRKILNGTPPANVLSFSGYVVTALYETYRANSLAYDPLDPMAKMLETLGERLEINLTSDEYYKLSALQRTQATTIWGIADESVRRQIMDELRKSAENGEAFFTAEPGKQSFYNRVKSMFGERFGYAGGDDRYPLAGWHLNTIYHTNLSTVTERANMDGLWDARESFPYIQYMNPDPVFPACMWLANRIFRIDDPVVRRFVPPLHFNCDTTIVGVYHDEIPLNKAGEPVYSRGEDLPPHVQPEVYGGPFKDPLKANPQPFGAWQPKDELLRGIEQIRFSPDSGSYIANKGADVKLKLNALRSEREAISKLTDIPDKEKERRMRIVGGRIADLKQARGFLTDLATPVDNVKRDRKLEKLRQRIYDSEAVNKSLKSILTEIADMPKPGSELYDQAVKNLGVTKRDFLYIIDHHDLTAAETFEIQTILLDKLKFDASVPSEVQNELIEAIRLMPTRHLARALLNAEQLEITLAEGGIAAYDPLSHSIRLVRAVQSGRIPADLQPIFLRELTRAVDSCYSSALPEVRKKKSALVRYEIAEWIIDRHPAELRRIFGRQGAYDLLASDQKNFYPLLVEAVFSWLNAIDGDYAEPKTKAQRRIRNIMRSPSMRLIILDFLREF